MKAKRFLINLMLALITLLITTGLAACTSRADQATLIGPEWRLASLNDEAVPGDVTISATFGDKEVGGSSGCNSYSGPYTVDGDKIQIGPMVATLMACDEPEMTWEGNYLNAMQAAQSYRVAGNQMEITSGEGVLLFNTD